MRYRMFATTSVDYPLGPTLDVLAEATGRSREALTEQLATVDKKALEAELKRLGKSLDCARVALLDLEAAWPEDEYEELQQLAIHERLGLPEPSPRPRRQRRVAVEQGFSLHADTAVHAHDRQRLERLARYAPVARWPSAA